MRVFSTELKIDLVGQIDQGKLTVLDVSRMYGVSSTSVYRWLRKYSDIYRVKSRTIVESKSLSKKLKELEKKNKDLEAALGRKTMRVDYLERIIESASKRLGEDIEKKNKPLS